MTKKHPFLVGIVLMGIIFLTYMFCAFVFSSRAGLLSEKVGVIFINGEITDPKLALEQIESVSENEQIKSVVIRIDSPGGSVAGTQEIFSAILTLKKKKPVVATLGSIATSGGYYIACAADKIVANPGTLTGSISAVMFFQNFQGLMKKIGVERSVIKSGKFKDIGSPVRKMTKEEAVLLQGVIDDVSSQFVSAVATSRKLKETDVKSIADGRIFTGRQAKLIGLVDELGGLNEAIDISAKLAGMTGKPKVIRLEKKSNRIVEYFFRDVAESFNRSIGAVAQPSILYRF
ncbi:MAG: signal peptide peptidase SppA [Deltaproteobacteria bacterium]